jgi:hypothetical protein
MSQNQTVVDNMSTYDIAEQWIHCGIDAEFEIESVTTMARMLLQSN